MNTAPQTRHERRRNATRQQLIRATLELVLEKGYPAVTVQDVTDRADLGRGTFYIHFRDKDEVLWAAFRERFGLLEAQAHSELDRAASQVEYYGLLNIFEHAGKNRDLYQVVFGSQGSALLSSRAQDFLAEALLSDIRQAPPPDVNFHIPKEFEAQFLTGILSRLLNWWLETASHYSAQEMAAMTYQALYRKRPPAATPHKTPRT